MTTNSTAPQWDPSQPPAPPQAPAPQKQKSWFLRHKFLSALLAIVVIALLSQAMGGGSKTPSSTTAGVPAGSGAEIGSDNGSDNGGGAKAEAPAAKVEAPAAKAEAPAAKVGSKVRDGSFEFTVTKVEKGVAQVGSQYFNEKAQGQFVLVHVTVANIGDQPQTLADSAQKVKDAKGREFSTASTAALMIEDNKVFFTDINPGNSVKGVLVYDMPKGATPASIELHDSLLSGGVTVSLS